MSAGQWVGQWVLAVSASLWVVGVLLMGTAEAMGRRIRRQEADYDR